MKLLRMSLFHLKRMLKDGKTIAIGILMPFIVITAINYFEGKDTNTSRANVAINIEQTGKIQSQYANEMIKDLNLTKSIFVNKKKDALEVLKKNDVIAVYNIPANFTEKIKQGKKPEIITYKKDDGNGTAPVEGQINNWINKKIQQNILIKNNIIKDEKELSKNTVKTIIKSTKKSINDPLLITVIMLLNFSIFSAIGVGTELISLKKQKILSRALTTSNKGWRIMGSIYIALVAVDVITNFSIIMVEKLIFGFALENMLLIFTNLVLMSLVAISMGIFVTRFIKNEAITVLIINLFCIATTFLGMAGMSESMKSSWIIENISRFVPQYWACKSIDTLTFFPSTIILMLMAIAFFTAGSIKIRNFVDK